DSIVTCQRVAIRLTRCKRDGSHRLPRPLDKHFLPWLGVMTDALPLRPGCPIESRGEVPLAENYRELRRTAQMRNASSLRTDVLGDREPLAQHLPCAVSQPEGNRRRPEI